MDTLLKMRYTASPITGWPWVSWYRLYPPKLLDSWHGDGPSTTCSTISKLKMSEYSVISAQHQFPGATDRCGSAMVLNEVQSPIRLTSVTLTCECSQRIYNYYHAKGGNSHVSAMVTYAKLDTGRAAPANPLLPPGGGSSNFSSLFSITMSVYKHGVYIDTIILMWL